MVTGVIAALIPNELAMFMLTFPYLASMISVLYIFLKQQGRAPTVIEKRYFTIAFILLFWLFNLLSIISCIAYFALETPSIWSDYLGYLHNQQFLLLILAMVVAVSIPFVLITLWFYGKQAQRMAKRMFA